MGYELRCVGPKGTVVIKKPFRVNAGGMRSAHMIGIMLVTLASCLCETYYLTHEASKKYATPNYECSTPCANSHATMLKLSVDNVTCEHL